MDDSTLGRLIQGGDERARVFRFSATGSAPFGERTQMTPNAAIAQGAARILAGAFGGRFGVGHLTGKLWTGRLADTRRVVKAL